MAARRLTDRILDLDTLEVLERVAETGSLTRAAAALGVTQQAVSARVGAAERALGRRLLRRSSGGSALTDDGRLVLELARPVLDAARRLDAGLGALGEVDGSLVVAASQTIAERMLPEWLQESRRRAPERSVRLVAGNSAAVADLVRTGDAQLGFVETPAELTGLASVVIAEDELVVVVAPDHPWASAAGIGAAELADTPLLVREEGSGTRATLDSWLGAAGLGATTPAAVLETSGIILANARAGIAPAVMSLRLVGADLASGALVRVALGGAPVVRPLRAVWAGHPSAAAAAFLEVARSLPG